MFEDYRRYITSVRNNLIQCGVEFPISPLETYEEVFYEAMKIDEVLWYYSILAVSGSDKALKGFILPLGGYYKEKMRQVFHNEFMEFIKDYRLISKTHTLLDGYEGSVDLMSIGVNDEEEVFDLFDEQPEEVKVEELKTDEQLEETQTEEQGYNNLLDWFTEELLQENNSPEQDFMSVVKDEYSPVDMDYSSHGVYLDEVLEEIDEEPEEEHEQESNNSNQSYGDCLDDLLNEVCGEEVEYQSHGVYIDEIINEEENQQIDNLLGVDDEETEYQPHGVFIDELIELDNTEQEVAEEVEDIWSNWDEEDEEEANRINSYVNQEEDDLEEVEEVEEETDDIWSNWDEEDAEEEARLSNSYQDEEVDEGEGVLDYESLFEDEDEEDDAITSSYNSSTEVDYKLSQPTPTEMQIRQSVSSTEPKKDLSDILQSTTNNLLTKGKKFLYREVKKRKDG